MRDIEHEIAERFRAQAGPGLPPPDLAARILYRVAAARRRRRAAEAAAVTLAVVAVIGLPAYVAANRQGERPATARPPASPTVGTAGRLPPSVPAADDAEIPRRLPGGWLLSVYGVGSDGGVLGVGVKYGTNGTQREDGRLWWIGTGGAASAPIAEPAGLWTAASGDGMIVWPEHRDPKHDFQLLCRSGGTARQVGDRGVAGDAGGFHVDRDVLVWTDESHHTVWMTRGCSGSPRAIDTAGYAVAFSYPFAYVVDGVVAGRVRQIDVSTGVVVSRTLPGAVTRNAAARFAAGPRTLSYSDGHGLVVIDTGTWQPHTVSTRLPHSTGLNGEETSLTAGERAVVYSTRPLDGDPDSAQAVVYRTGQAEVSALEGEAYTKGTWLVWRDHDVYRLRNLSPHPP